jgi:predicted dinucleotide-binding enzyme
MSAKILVDCTNPLLSGTSSLAVGHTTSAAEQIAGWAEGASVVKTFNSTGSVNMVDPRYGSQPASMFLCGDDSKAKSVVARLGEEIGFEMIDAGPLANARLLEPLAMLWISLAYRQGLGPNIAFKLLRR